MGYKKYAKDYKPKLVSVNDGRGVKEIYVYNGPYFTARFSSDAEKKRAKLLCLLSAVVCCLLFAAAGFVDAMAARQIYIAIPFVVEMAPAAFFAVGAVLAVRAPEKMKREETDRSWRRVRNMSTILAVLAGVVCIESILYMIITKNAAAIEFLFMGLSAAIGAISGLTSYFLHKRCKIELLEPEENS